MDYTAIAQKYIDSSDPKPQPGETIDRDQMAEKLKADPEYEGTEFTPEDVESIASEIERIVNE